MKKAIIISLSLATFTAIGSVNLIQAVPYIVIGAVVVVSVLIALGKINPRYYPIYIFGLALSLLWQTSMLGTYIVGVDIHTEYFVTNQAITNGWNPNWPNNSNTSLILAWLVPFIDRLGIGVVWQFKALFPFICAFTPVVLFYAFRNLFGDKRSYFAVLFFMTMPMFTMEVVSMVKSQVAYLLVAGMVFFLVSKMKPWQKALGITLSTTGMVLSHYAVAIIIVAYLIAMLGILTVTNWGKLRGLVGKSRIPLRYSALSIIGGIAVFYLWFANIGGGATLNTVFAIGENIAGVTAEVATGGNTNGVANEDMGDRSETAAGMLTSEGKIDDYLQFTNPTGGNTYLSNQAPLVRAAIGLDFGSVSVWGKGFRVVQYLTQIFMVAGFAYVFLNRKKFNFTAEYKAALIASFGLLAACIFLPFFTTTLSPTRFYVITLFFISPLLIIGLEEPLRRWIK